MKVPEKTIFRDIGRVLQFAPCVIFFFLSFSFWKKGLTEPAIIFGLMGIGLILLVCLLGITQRIIGHKKRFVIVCAVLLICIGLYFLITGDFYPGIGLTLLGVAFILEMTFPQKKWQIGITVVVLLALGGITYLEHFSGDKTQPAGSEVGDKQNAVVKNKKPHSDPSVKASALDSPKSPLVSMMNQFLTPDQRSDPKVQEMMAMMDSDSFQEQLKEQNPQTLEEFYQFLASQGVTELSQTDIDKVLDDRYRIVEANYNAKNPGVAPEDEDEVMAKRLAAAIDKDGHIKGMNKFMSENGMWLAVRFHEDEEAFDKWWVDVRTKYETGDFTTSKTPQTDLDLARNEQEASSFREDNPSLPFVETEQTQGANAPNEVWEDPRIPDTLDRSLQSPAVEPEKVVTEVPPQPPALPTEAQFEASLKERFSKDRFDRAMDTLDRYGEEEGLRRLKEDDPEVAKQIEASRNGRERHRQRRGEEEDSQ